MSALEVMSITKRWRRDGRPVLDDVSLSVGEGEVVYLLGPNGSGKSTLLKIVAGQMIPDSGKVRLDGRSVVGRPLVALAPHVAYVAQNQETCTYGDQTVLEHLILSESFAGRGVPWLFPKWRARRQVTERLLGLGVALAERLDNQAGTLSGGERQCLSLLMHTLRRPKVLLLDEPTRELDARARLEVDRLIQRLLSEHRPATIVVTHEYDEALRQADRIVLMRDGRLVGEMSSSAGNWNPSYIQEALWGVPEREGALDPGDAS